MREKIVILPKIHNCGGDLSKKWFIYYSYRDHKTGKMHRFKHFKGLHKIKDYHERMRVAEKVCEELDHKLRSGWSPFKDDSKAIYADQLQYQNIVRIYGNMRKSNKTFNFYASKFIQSLQGLEHETIGTYTSKLRIFAQWLDHLNLSDNDMSSIDNDLIIEFFSFLNTNRKVSRVTYEKYKQLLYKVFEIAQKERKIYINPVQHLPVCKRENDQTPRPISRGDLDIFKKELRKDLQLWLSCQFEFYCYVRPGKELRTLKIGQIDFDAGNIMISKSVAKTDTDKILIIPDVFLKEIQWLRNYPRHYYVFSKEGKPGSVMLGRNNLRYRFVRIRKKLNMPEHYKHYSFKHTGNVEAERAGIGPTERQAQNGHKYVSTTEIYTRNKIGFESEKIRHAYPEI